MLYSLDQLKTEANHARTLFNWKIVLASGGFDPFHIGHLKYINGSAEHGKLCVAVNGDEFLRRKKGYIFMPAAERAEIIAALRNVFAVVIWDHDDVSGLIQELKPDIFCNGGDRSHPESWHPAETAACKQNGTVQLGSIGGSEKLQASQNLLEKAMFAVLHRNIKSWHDQLLAENIMAGDKETR